jgi:hypothetical protein
MPTRRAILILGGIFGCLTFGFGQQARSGPKTVLTPEQPALQQPVKQAGADRGNLRNAGQEAFDAEMAREKAGDCPDAHGNYEFIMCYEKALTAAAQHLKTYQEIIRDLLSRRGSDANGQPAPPAPAGPFTSAQLVAEFDHLEQVWHPYLDAACTAAFHQFGAGTGGASSADACSLRFMRSHMRDLDGIYDGLLHR